MKLASLVGSSSTYYRSVMTYARNGGAAEQLLQFGTQGGLIAREGSSYVYKYLKTDHLGSTRVVLAARSGQLQEEQRTDYYPYGLSHSLSNLHLNKFLFSGKELQDANIGSTGMLGLYDFHARYYNPFLGRWFNIDPALQFTNPYIYCGNSPQMYIDPDGEFAWVAAVFVVLKAAGISAAVSTAVYTANVAISDGGFDNWSWSQFGKSAWIGALSGAVGGAAGVAVGALFSSSSGFLYGFATGGAGGFFGGFTGASVGAWTDGASFAEGARQGFIYGNIGAATGGLVGGATQGFRAMNQGLDFWTGAPKMQPGTSPLLRIDTPELDQQIRNNTNGGADRRIDYKPTQYEADNMAQYEKLVEAAKQQYPNKAGMPDELHHIEPRYIGGPANGDLKALNPAYHQQITNEFRRLQPYGTGPLLRPDRLDLMQQVYKKYPLPPTVTK